MTGVLFDKYIWLFLIASLSFESAVVYIASHVIPGLMIDKCAARASNKTASCASTY